MGLVKIPQVSRVCQPNCILLFRGIDAQDAKLLVALALDVVVDGDLAYHVNPTADSTILMFWRSWGLVGSIGRSWTTMMVPRLSTASTDADVGSLERSMSRRL